MTGQGAPPVSVVILGWRRADLLARCLDALAASVGGDQPQPEVVLVLNNPVPEVLRLAEERRASLTVVDAGANLGFGGGCTLGLERSAGEFVAFLNDDAQPEPRWLSRLVSTAVDNPRAAAVGSLVLDPEGAIEELGCDIDREGVVQQRLRGVARASVTLPDQPVAARYVSGSAMLVRRAAFEQVGGFDPRYHPAYFEDVDLCLRLAAAGHQILVEPGAVVVHAQSSSTSAPYKRFLTTRGQRIFLAKWGWQRAGDATPEPTDCEIGRPLADRVALHQRLDALVHAEFETDLTERLLTTQAAYEDRQREVVRLAALGAEAAEREQAAARQIEHLVQTREEVIDRLHALQARIDGLTAQADSLHAHIARQEEQLASLRHALSSPGRALAHIWRSRSSR